jgi:NAD(P)-dependent dehydrogenase (short-subunit alcohol dehydrogenase family)
VYCTKADTPPAQYSGEHHLTGHDRYRGHRAGPGDSQLPRQSACTAIIKRVAQPEDIAWLATYLASDESTWVTAADFNIDGGATAL